MAMPVGEIEVETVGGEVATVADVVPLKEIEVSLENVSLGGQTVGIETAEIVVPGTLVVTHKYSRAVYVLEPGQTDADVPADFPPDGIVFRKAV